MWSLSDSPLPASQTGELIKLRNENGEKVSLPTADVTGASGLGRELPPHTSSKYITADTWNMK